MADVLFWCEFPDSIDWNSLDKLLTKNNLKVRTYVAAVNKQDFKRKRKRIRKCKNVEVEGVWPTLPLNKGYWFSGFLDCKDIDKLDEFKGINMKIDIEPPFSQHKKGSFDRVLWLTKHFLKKQKNGEYIKEKIQQLSKKSKIILSTLPCPLFSLRHYGFFEDNKLGYNFMHYSTFIPKIYKPFYKMYYKGFIRRRLRENKNNYFALGLIGTGIFGNEPVYKNVEEFRADIKFLKGNNVKNFVIFRLGAILERKTPDRWIKAIKEI